MTENENGDQHAWSEMLQSLKIQAQDSAQSSQNAVDTSGSQLQDLDQQQSESNNDHIFDPTLTFQKIDSSETVKQKVGVSIEDNNDAMNIFKKTLESKIAKKQKLQEKKKQAQRQEQKQLIEAVLSQKDVLQQFKYALTSNINNQTKKQEIEQEDNSNSYASLISASEEDNILNQFKQALENKMLDKNKKEQQSLSNNYNQEEVSQNFEPGKAASFSKENVALASQEEEEGNNGSSVSEISQNEEQENMIKMLKNKYGTQKNDTILTGATKESSANNKEMTEQEAVMKQFKQALARKLLIKKKVFESASDIEKKKNKQIDAAGSPQGIELLQTFKQALETKFSIQRLNDDQEDAEHSSNAKGRLTTSQRSVSEVQEQEYRLMNHFKEAMVRRMLHKNEEDSFILPDDLQPNTEEQKEIYQKSDDVVQTFKSHLKKNFLTNHNLDDDQESKEDLLQLQEQIQVQQDAVIKQFKEALAAKMFKRKKEEEFKQILANDINYQKAQTEAAKANQRQLKNSQSPFSGQEPPKAAVGIEEIDSDESQEVHYEKEIDIMLKFKEILAQKMEKRNQYKMEIGAQIDQENYSSEENYIQSAPPSDKAEHLSTEESQAFDLNSSSYAKLIRGNLGTVVLQQTSADQQESNTTFHDQESQQDKDLVEKFVLDFETGGENNPILAGIKDYFNTDQEKNLLFKMELKEANKEAKASAQLQNTNQKKTPIEIFIQNMLVKTKFVSSDGATKDEKIDDYGSKFDQFVQQNDKRDSLAASQAYAPQNNSSSLSLNQNNRVVVKDGRKQKKQELLQVGSRGVNNNTRSTISQKIQKFANQIFEQQQQINSIQNKDHYDVSFGEQQHQLSLLNKYGSNIFKQNKASFITRTAPDPNLQKLRDRQESKKQILAKIKRILPKNSNIKYTKELENLNKGSRQIIYASEPSSQQESQQTTQQDLDSNLRESGLQQFIKKGEVEQDKLKSLQFFKELLGDSHPECRDLLYKMQLEISRQNLSKTEEEAKQLASRSKQLIMQDKNKFKVNKTLINESKLNPLFVKHKSLQLPQSVLYEMEKQRQEKNELKIQEITQELNRQQNLSRVQSHKVIASSQSNNKNSLLKTLNDESIIDISNIQKPGTPSEQTRGDHSNLLQVASTYNHSNLNSDHENADDTDGFNLPSFLPKQKILKKQQLFSPSMVGIMESSSFVQYGNNQRNSQQLLDPKLFKANLCEEEIKARAQMALLRQSMDKETTKRQILGNMKETRLVQDSLKVIAEEKQREKDFFRTNSEDELETSRKYLPQVSQSVPLSPMKTSFIIQRVQEEQDNFKSSVKKIVANRKLRNLCRQSTWKSVNSFLQRNESNHELLHDSLMNRDAVEKINQMQTSHRRLEVQRLNDNIKTDNMKKIYKLKPPPVKNKTKRNQNRKLQRYSTANQLGDNSTILSNTDGGIPRISRLHTSNNLQLSEQSIISDSLKHFNGRYSSEKKQRQVLNIYGKKPPIAARSKRQRLPEIKTNNLHQRDGYEGQNFLIQEFSQMVPKRQMTHAEHNQNTVIEEVSGIINSSDAELQAMASVTETKHGTNNNNSISSKQKDNNLSVSNTESNLNQDLHQQFHSLAQLIQQHGGSKSNEENNIASQKLMLATGQKTQEDMEIYKELFSPSPAKIQIQNPSLELLKNQIAVQDKNQQLNDRQKVRQQKNQLLNNRNLSMMYQKPPMNLELNLEPKDQHLQHIVKNSRVPPKVIKQQQRQLLESHSAALLLSDDYPQQLFPSLQNTGDGRNMIKLNVNNQQLRQNYNKGLLSPNFNTAIISSDDGEGNKQNSYGQVNSRIDGTTINESSTSFLEPLRSKFWSNRDANSVLTKNSSHQAISGGPTNSISPSRQYQNPIQTRLTSQQKFKKNQMKAILQRKLLENSSGEDDSNQGSDQYRFNAYIPDEEEIMKQSQELFIAPHQKQVIIQKNRMTRLEGEQPPEKQMLQLIEQANNSQSILNNNRRSIINTISQLPQFHGGVLVGGLKKAKKQQLNSKSLQPSRVKHSPLKQQAKQKSPSIREQPNDNSDIDVDTTGPSLLRLPFSSSNYGGLMKSLAAANDSIEEKTSSKNNSSRLQRKDGRRLRKIKQQPNQGKQKNMNSSYASKVNLLSNTQQQQDYIQLLGQQQKFDQLRLLSASDNSQVIAPSQSMQNLAQLNNRGFKSSKPNHAGLIRNLSKLKMKQMKQEKLTRQKEAEVAARAKEFRAKTAELGQDFDEHIDKLVSFMCIDNDSNRELRVPR